MKLLSPAGDFQSLKSAVFGGADEVYLGVNNFNARNNVDSFTLDNIKEAIDFAHLYGVKVCLTVNILFTDKEMHSAVDLCVKCHNFGVDAIIICDLGLASILSKNYPEITLHASTQLGIHNLEGVLALKDFNFKRVVLARETPLSEIKRIKDNCDIEIEYFIHGALCVCFSGNCYMSAKLFDASGNRGKCKQLCRLPFTLNLNDKPIKNGFLLSAKDFNMIDRLPDLEKAGVDVLKIEGRARRPFYVYQTTKSYKNALMGKKIDRQKLNLAFNRGFNQGYFNGNGDMISDYNNHVGIRIGEVVKVESGKRFNQVFIDTKYPLSPKSALKFFVNEKEVATASPVDVKQTSNGYSFTTTTQIPVKSKVSLMTDAYEETQVSLIKQKNYCEISLTALKGKPLSATLTVRDITFTLTGETLEQAKSQPLTLADASENFAKSEYFTPHVTLETDGVFIPKQQLNDFRRRVYDKAFELLTKTQNAQLNFTNLEKPNGIKKVNDYAFYTTENAQITSKIAIYSPEVYTIEKTQEFVNNCNVNGAKAYLDTPNFAQAKDIRLLKEIVLSTGIGVLANNLYALTLTSNIIVGAGLNVYNGYTAQVLNAPVFTFESDVGTHLDFALMTLKHCPMKSHLGCDCKTCKYQDGFEYQMSNGKKFKLKRKKLSDCTFYLTE